MTKRNKDALDFPAIPFDEALARLIQTDPKEIVDAIEQTRQRTDDIKRSAEERRRRLREAIAGPKKQFRL